MNIGCARHSSSKLDSALACTTFKFFEYLAALGRAQASLALLLLARHLNSLNIGCTRHSIQVNLMTLLSFARHFRENGRYCCYRMCKIIYSLADNHILSPKHTSIPNEFLCEIIQLAVFLCVISAICGRITRKSTQSIYSNETPYISRRSRRQTTKLH